MGRSPVLPAVVLYRPEAPVNYGKLFIQQQFCIELLLCRFQQSTLLGVASIPLSPLLQESWVQGTAPVLAVMTKPDGQTQDRVQVPLTECTHLMSAQTHHA